MQQLGICPPSHAAVGLLLSVWQAEDISQLQHGTQQQVQAVPR